MRLLLCCPVPTTDPSTISPKYKLESIRYIKKCIIEYAATAAHHYRPSTGSPLGTNFLCPVAAPCLPTCPLAHMPGLAAFLRVVTSNPRHAGLTHSANQKPTFLDGKITRKYWAKGAQMIT